MTPAERGEKLCEDIDALCREVPAEYAFASLLDLLSEFVFDRVETLRGSAALMQEAHSLVASCFTTAFQATCQAHGRQSDISGAN